MCFSAVANYRLVSVGSISDSEISAYGRGLFAAFVIPQIILVTI
jgi:hypothetical protein